MISAFCAIWYGKSLFYNKILIRFLNTWVFYDELKIGVMFYKSWWDAAFFVIWFEGVLLVWIENPHSDASDQPRYPTSLIRPIAVPLKKTMARGHHFPFFKKTLIKLGIASTPLGLQRYTWHNDCLNIVWQACTALHRHSQEHCCLGICSGLVLPIAG